MSICQRFLSKSLMFFSVFFLIFLLFVESNMGFKWFFNFTNRFFIGLKAEEISGNWRDFTLKNIKYNVFGITIAANSVHVIVDPRSLFKIATIFKKIETKNLIVSLKKNMSSNFLKKNMSSNIISSNIIKKNFFIKYPIIFQNIHVDKFFFKSPKVNIFFLNVLSGVKLINNNVIFSPTYVDSIHVASKRISFKKKNILNKLIFKKKINNTETTHSFLQFFSNQKINCIPFNINLKLLRCNRIELSDYKNDNIFQLELKAKTENSVLKIKNIKLSSAFFQINSYGRIYFDNDHSISCLMNNRILIPRFHNRIITVSFKSHLNAYNRLVFQLNSKNLYKIKIYGSILLNHSDYPLFIKLKIKNLLWSIKKKSILKIDNLHGVLKGKINNYVLSLKNIFALRGLPSISMDIKGEGNLKNIFLKKIKLLPIKRKKFYKKIINSVNNLKYNQSILKLIGKIDIVGKSDKTYNLYVPKINLNGNIMRKKFSILGSLSYKNLNFIETPGINVLLGDNKLYLRGLLGKQYKIYSAFNANNLDYFLPNLKGRIKAKVNFNGSSSFSNMTSKIAGSHLDWNNTYFKKVEIFTKINMNNAFLGKILIDAKKINLYNFYINTLHIQTGSNNDKQNLYFLLKSPALYINFKLNGSFDKKSGNWHGVFKKMNIKTIWGQITAKKNNLIDYHDSNDDISNFYKRNIKKRNIFLSTVYNTKMSFFNIFNPLSFNFTSQLSVNSKLKWILGEKISDGKITLTSNYIKLEKKINKKVLIEKIDYLKIFINLIKNNFKSKWIVKKISSPLKDQSIIGYLNIIDIYDKKIINGKFNVSNFPFTFINFFTTSFKQVNGIFQSKIKFFGTFYQPKISADVNFQNIFIKSNNILKYITLFFPYFLGKVDAIKINQEIVMEKGNIVFTLQPFFKDPDNIEWTLFFNSKKISVLVFPKMKVKFSSQLNLHYLLSKYDLIGYIKISLFYFKINEKNFIF